MINILQLQWNVGYIHIYLQLYMTVVSLFSYTTGPPIISEPIVLTVLDSYACVPVFSLTCRAASELAVNFTWTHNGCSVANGSKQFYINDNYIHESVLTVIGSELVKYICLVENKKGNASSLINIEEGKAFSSNTIIL